MDEEIRHQDLKNLIDPDFVLFGKAMNPQVKIAHRVEVIDSQIVIHQDQFSTKRFQQIMELAKGKNSEDEQEQAMKERIWQQQMRNYEQGQLYEDEEDDGWVTQQQEERYLGWNQSPMKAVGVMNIESQMQLSPHQ